MSDQPIDVQLAQFRAACPLAHCRHAEEIWRYRRVGRGKAAVLWLTGALGVAELAFQSLLAIGRQFTVVAPDYPSTPTLDAFCDGLIAILNQERIEKAHVVGGSLGGMTAQHLIRRYPDRVLSLVLSHTAAPESNRLFIGAVRVLVGTLPVWPESLVRKLFSRRLRVGFTAAGPFWLHRIVWCSAANSCLIPLQLSSDVRPRSRSLSNKTKHSYAHSMPTITAGDRPMTVINIFTVVAAQQARLVELLTQATESSIRHVPGFVGAALHRSLDGTKVTMYAQWATPEDYERMRARPDASPILTEALSIARFDPGFYEVTHVFNPDTSRPAV